MPVPQQPGGDPAPDSVTRVEDWAVVSSDGKLRAVSRRCRHQLADLAAGSVDSEGCLVCPWHGSRYDVESGEMVQGPKGFFSYHGPTPRYGRLIAAFGRVVPLRTRAVRRRGDGSLEIIPENQT